MTNDKQPVIDLDITAVAPTNTKKAHPDNIHDAIRAIVEPLGGIELNIPPRRKGSSRPPPDFSGPEFGTDD